MEEPLGRQFFRGGSMLKLDHLTIPVSNRINSRDWYVGILGLRVEFEISDRWTVAVQDQNDFTIFLVQAPTPLNGAEFAFSEKG
jgi:catechol 2,3-dioxygenase-like lactoylglutathione lyase family enzyme